MPMPTPTPTPTPPVHVERAPARARAASGAAALVLLALAGVADLAAQPAPRKPRRPAVDRTPPAAALAEAGRCRDPITGTWRARVWRAESSTWDRVTVSVKRRGVQHSGNMWVESWDGDAEQLEPPICPDGSPALERWQQRLRGAVIRGRVAFHGDRVRKLAGACEPPGAADTSRPDHFPGVLAPDADVLLMTNDDGGADRGRPHHFLRVSCSP